MKSLLTIDGREWFETLPYMIGLLFVVTEIFVCIFKRRPLNAAQVGYMFGEGITICLLPIYGYGLMFNHKLAAMIAEKNSKVLAVAMFVSFITLFAHIWSMWWGDRH